MSDAVIAYDPLMARWQPGSRDRLTLAAVDLFVEHGFDAVTAAEIAARAGLTERTFFRHFADKREVLFPGQDELADVMTARVAAAPHGTSPLDAVAGGLEAFGGVMLEREALRRRQIVIREHPGLQERELSKLAVLSQATRRALQARGVPDLSAELAAEMGMTVFRTAFRRWLDAEDDRPFARFVQECMVELHGVTAPG